MASRHDIIQIDFRANAGRANPAIESLRKAAKSSRDEITRLKKELADGTAAGNGKDWITQQNNKIKETEKSLKSYEKAERELVKGVDTLSRAIDAFNNGSLNNMSAAFQKAAQNAANLARSKISPNTEQGKKSIAELDALMLATQKNLVKSKEDFRLLTQTIEQGGKVSVTELNMAKTSLRELSDLTARGTKEWKTYQAQLATVEAKIRSITVEEQRVAGQKTLGQTFRGDFAGADTKTLEQTITKLREYQSVIADPEGKGARHFQATETAIRKLSEQLGRTKNDVVSVGQAMKVAGAASTANRFGAGLEEHSKRVSNSYKSTINTLKQLQQARAYEDASIIRSEEKLAQYDSQIAAVTARQEKLRSELIRSGDANNLNTKQVAQSIQVLRQQQETVAVGSPAWQKYEAAIASLEERMKIMKGEAISLRDAMKLSGNAGGMGFTGSAQQLQLAEQALQKAAATAKKGSPEWTRYQEALAKVRVEMQNTGMTSERMRAILDKPANAKNLNELSAAVKRAKAELDLMAGTVGKNSKEYAQLAAQTKTAELQLKEMQSAAKGTASAFDKAWSRLKTYVGLYVGAAVAMQKITATMGDLMELSDKMGEVRKTTGFTADEVGRLTNNLAKLDTRTSLVSLTELASLAGSVGLKTQQDIQGFTEAADQLIVALPEMGNESARTLIKIATATGDLEKNNNNVRETLEKVGSTIIALRANSASASGPITDFVSRVGAVGAQAGISIDQIAALGSTIDALGGRVEMSATALSRMIPAIRNNTFSIGAALGITEKELKNMTAMEQMVTIFRELQKSVKGIDTSTEEGMNAMADNVEAVLGKNATMAEVMKELNQQGARAGIVFGLLSQNVGELERQLGIASEAYRSNTALMNEYNNMNETTAAKWARLKNQVEEFFVGDSAQRWLGHIIDGLRKVVDLLTGNGGVSVGLRMIIAYMAALRLGLAEIAVGGLKAVWNGIKNIGVALGIVRGEMTKMQMANIFTALATAALLAYQAIKRWHEEAMAAAREAAQFAAELQKEQAKVDELTKSVAKASVNVDDARSAVAKARKELDEAKKSTDGSKESTERLSKAEKELFDAENNLRKAQDDHTRSIQQINSQYGKYLGFMLSEVSSAAELAAARELINDKLRETITLKRKEAALGRIEESMGEGRDDRYASLSDLISRSITSKDANGKRIQDPKKAARIMADITKAAQQEYATMQDFTKAVYKILSNEGYVGDMWDAWKSNIAGKAASYYKEVANIRKKNNEIEQQFAAEESAHREQSQKDLVRQYKAAEQNYIDLENEYAKATGNARKKAAANLLKQMDTISEMVDNADNYYDLTNKNEKASYNQFVAGNEARINGMKERREALLKEAGEAYKARTKVGGGSTVPNPVNPYGTFNRVTSDYGDWDADTLVNRRKEMLERVRALANGADVQAVLSEDAKFITEATRKNIKTTRDAIEWYNTERLKIQDALHEKHLTNTGDWMDPKKGGKKASKLVQDEMKYYLDELDAYYTERKTRIQEAGTEEGVTEAEVKNRTLANEMEWHQRRAELQKLYAKKSAEVVKDEQDAIFDILSERTGEATSYIQKDIANTVKFIEKVGAEKGKPAMDRILGDLDLGIERDFLKQQQAVTTQMKAIRDIIEKERPYDGITRNLRENLVTMGILTADMTKERNRLMRENADMSEFNNRQATEELKRTAFMLREAENAYSTTIEEVMRHMGEQGMQAWADAIQGDKQMQQALMAQLRTAYDQIQDAIKKEASLIKKQTDIWWADIEKGQTLSRRDGFEKMLSRLGLAEDQVKRANSLIGAGQASERVADRLAIKQMQVQLAMQQAYYAKMRQIGEERIAQLEAEGRLEDAEHLRRSLNLAKTEELKKLEEQRVAIANQLEESSNRLYTELRGWADLLASSLQSVFEASHAGDAEYYNELAKLDLTGRGGPGAGSYVVTDNAGTKNARAHYEYLDERAALDRQREIEQQNAVADAWKKVMDDINMKMSDNITDLMNAMLQNASINANTTAVSANTDALGALSEQMAQGIKANVTQDGDGASLPRALRKRMGLAVDENPHDHTQVTADPTAAAQAKIDASNAATQVELANQQAVQRGELKTDNTIAAGAQSAYAKMTQAANLYGIAYQAMSNDNLSTAQKFEMIAVQAAGSAAIAALTANFAENTGVVAGSLPAILAECLKINPIWGAVIFAALSATLGGLMGVAVSKIAKSKSQIAQATGASASASAGKLTTGMLTYAEGNVNEFTDPASLTPGQQYNVDAADGRTYRARYMGSNPKTHLTNGPEFHLSGERGREMIIDAGTTRQITMNEAEIWHTIQALSGGGRIAATRRRSSGMRAFADGNVGDFEEVMGSDSIAAGTGVSAEQTAALQASLDRNSEVLERALREGIKGVFDVYNKGGLVDTYDTAKKELNRYGAKY